MLSQPHSHGYLDRLLASTVCIGNSKPTRLPPCQCSRMSLLEFRYLGAHGVKCRGNFSISYIDSRLYVRAYNKTLFCGDLSGTVTTFAANGSKNDRSPLPIQWRVSPTGGSASLKPWAALWNGEAIRGDRDYAALSAPVFRRNSFQIRSDLRVRTTLRARPTHTSPKDLPLSKDPDRNQKWIR